MGERMAKARVWSFRLFVFQYAVFYPKTEKYVGVFSPADDDKSKKQYVDHHQSTRSKYLALSTSSWPSTFTQPSV